MNDTPHLLAIIESKLAQLRTNIEHDNPVKAKDLLAQIRVYSEALQSDL